MILLISVYALSVSSFKEVAEDIVKSFPLLPWGHAQFQPHLLQYWLEDYRWLERNDRTPSFNEEMV